MTYGISTSILGHLPLEQALRRLAAEGIGQIEISTESPHFSPGAYVPADVRGWLDELGLNAPVGHLVHDIRRRPGFEHFCHQLIADVGVR